MHDTCSRTPYNPQNSICSFTIFCATKSFILPFTVFYEQGPLCTSHRTPVLSSQLYVELCVFLKSLTFRKYSFKHLDCNDYDYTTDEEDDIIEWYCRQELGDVQCERMMEGCEEALDYG